jgi:hypothetical protein
MLRHAIIGFAAAALVSTTFIPDEALARGGGGFHGGGFRGGARFGVGYRPIPARPLVPATAAREAAVGTAVGALAIGAAGAMAVGEAVGAARVGGYHGNSHSRTALAAPAAKNARDVGSFERRGAAVGAAVGAPAATVYYGYCNRDSRGSLVCPYQSSAAGHQGP